jgi:hypothetical protein
MKVFAFTLALAGATTAASLNAQVRPGTVISRSSQRGTDCSYNRTTNGIGDIIFGRMNFNTNCRDVYSREDGGWYQVGNGRSQIYERRVRDNYGYLIIQRARRNPNGTFTILNTRLANDNDKEWRKEQKRYEKAQKRDQKEWEKAQKRNGNYGYNRDGDDDDNRYRDANYRYDQFGNRIYVGPTVNTNRDYSSKQNGHGRGKGKKGRD